MSVRRSLFVLTLLIAALPVVIFSARANRPEAVATNIQEYIIQRGDVELTVSAIGTVEADHSADLSFTAPGRIIEIPVQVGDTVVAGDVLARQVNDAQQIAYDQAQLALQLAQLQKDRLLAGPDESEIAIAEANVNSALGAVSSIQSAVSPDDLRAAELSYQQAQAAFAAAQHDRAFNGGTEAEANALEAKLGEATFNAEIARLNLESLRNGNSAQVNTAYARVTQAQAELERLQAGATDAEISRADAAIAQAQIGVDRAQTALDRTLLTAPFDGIVTMVNAEVGALVASSTALIEIADVSPLRLVVQVDEIDVRQIAVGLPARVRFDALSEVELAATLEAIALVPTNNDGVVSYEVTVQLDDSDPRARVGMTAEALFVVETRQQVLIVPNRYIRLDRQQDQAYINLVTAEGALEEIPVTLGLQGQEQSEISAGLEAGDIIGIDLSADQISLFGS